VHDDFPAQTRSNTVLVDLFRQSLKELEEEDEVQMLEERRP